MAGVQPAASIFSLFRFALELITESISRDPSMLYDTTNSWVRPLNEKDNFLENFDLPFSREPARLLLKATNIENVSDAVKDLPTQEEHTTYSRVFCGESRQRNITYCNTCFRRFPCDDISVGVVLEPGSLGSVLL
jgi:hypothetical protein